MTGVYRARRVGLFIAKLDEAVSKGAWQEIDACIDKPPAEVRCAIEANKQSYNTEDYRRREEIHNEEAVKAKFGAEIRQFTREMHNRDNMPIHSCSCR